MGAIPPRDPRAALQKIRAASQAVSRYLDKYGASPGSTAAFAAKNAIAEADNLWMEEIAEWTKSNSVDYR